MSIIQLEPDMRPRVPLLRGAGVCLHRCEDYVNITCVNPKIISKTEQQVN